MSFYTIILYIYIVTTYKGYFDIIFHINFSVPTFSNILQMLKELLNSGKIKSVKYLRNLATSLNLRVLSQN